MLIAEKSDCISSILGEGKRDSDRFICKRRSKQSYKKEKKIYIDRKSGLQTVPRTGSVSCWLRSAGFKAEVLNFISSFLIKHHLTGLSIYPAISFWT